MVQALIDLNEEESRIVNTVKGMLGLKNKSEALKVIIRKYKEELMGPELRPEFVKKMEERAKEPTVKVKDFMEHFGLK